MRSIFLFLASLALWPTLASSPSLVMPTYITVEDAKSPSILMAIWSVESSNGEDCRPGAAGEISCYQILPTTASLLSCPSAWRKVDSVAAACAARWLKRGKHLCRRWDIYGQARWYNRGKCMKWDSRPSGYEMDVARARLKFLM